LSFAAITDATRPKQILIFNLVKPKTQPMCCDQKLASDSSGLPGGFSGQRAWVRIFKKWAPGSYCLELVVACPAAGTSALILLVEGK
jgi:hypothetical protein